MPHISHASPVTSRYLAIREALQALPQDRPLSAVGQSSPRLRAGDVTVSIQPSPAVSRQPEAKMSERQAFDSHIERIANVIGSKEAIGKKVEARKLLFGTKFSATTIRSFLETDVKTVEQRRAASDVVWERAYRLPSTANDPTAVNRPDRSSDDVWARAYQPRQPKQGYRP